MKNNSKRNLVTRNPYAMSKATQRAYRKYYGTSRQRQEMKEQTMPEFARDIYSAAIDGLPLGLQLEIQQNQELLMEEVYNIVIPKYGELYVFFSNNEQFGAVTDIGYNVYLTSEKRSELFLWSYARWYITYRKNHDSDIVRALTEWSGVPEDIQEKAYWGIVKFVQYELIDYHRREREFSRNINIPANAKELTVNIYAGGNANIHP